MVEPTPRIDGATWSDGALESGFASPRAAARLSWRSRVGGMLRFEAALARVQARAGLVDPAVAAAIERACDLDRLDLERLARAAATAPTPVIPLLTQLREQIGPDAAAAVHLGATSQDAIDTATMLQVRDVLDLLDEVLDALSSRCRDLAQEHRDTIVAGRTLGQQAVPVTVGLRAARWLDALSRRAVQLDGLRREVVAVQYGGAAGTLSVLGAAGPDVADALAEELGLAAPAVAWHAERDRIAELGGAVAALVTSLDAIATDLIAAAATGVAEVREAGGDGPGSSTMPHKRNPVHATAVRAACRVASAQLTPSLTPGDHAFERAAGAWQAEWVALPGGLVHAVGAAERLLAALQGLEIDPARGEANLDLELRLTLTEALTAALRPELGADAASLTAELATTATTQGRSLADVAAADERVTAVLDDAALAHALDPANTLGAVDRLIDRAIAAADRRRAGS